MREPPVAEQPARAAGSARARSPMRREAGAAQPLLRHRADAPDPAAPAAARGTRAPPSRPHLEQTVGLGEVAGDLRHHLHRRDPHRDRRARSPRAPRARSRSPTSRGRTLQPLGAGQIEEGLVQGQSLHHRREAAEDLEDAPRLGRVLRIAPRRNTRPDSGGAPRPRASPSARRSDAPRSWRPRRRRAAPCRPPPPDARAARGGRAARWTRRRRPCRRGARREERGSLARRGYRDAGATPPATAGMLAAPSVSRRPCAKRRRQADRRQASAGTSPTSTRVPTTRRSRSTSPRPAPRRGLRRALPRARRRASPRASWRGALDELEALQEPVARAGALRRAALRRRHGDAAPRRAAPARAGTRHGDPQRPAVLRARVGRRRTSDAAEALLADPGPRAAAPLPGVDAPLPRRTCSASPRSAARRDAQHRQPRLRPAVRRGDGRPRASRSTVAGETAAPRARRRRSPCSTTPTATRAAQRPPALTAGPARARAACSASSSTPWCRTRRRRPAAPLPGPDGLRATSPTRSTARAVDALLERLRRALRRWSRATTG